jgi:hypothetical protein
LARRVAEAHVDVTRVRRARHDIIARAQADPRYLSPRGLRARIVMLSRAGDLLRRGLPVPPDLNKAIASRPQGPQKFALILADHAGELAAMDRYERRALSRRKAAIRELDAVSSPVPCSPGRGEGSAKSGREPGGAVPAGESAEQTQRPVSAEQTQKEHPAPPDHRPRPLAKGRRAKSESRFGGRRGVAGVLRHQDVDRCRDLGLAAADRPEQVGIVGECGLQVRMRMSAPALESQENLDMPAHQPFGLVDAIGCEQQTGQVVEVDRDAGMVGPVVRFIDGKGPPHHRFGIGEAVRVEQQ